MDQITVGIIGMSVLIVLLFTSLHIGIVMGIIGFLGVAFLNGWPAGLTILKTVPYSTWNTYDFAVVPFFILMGEFCFHGGISDDLFSTAYKFLGDLKGGLAMATIGACALFAAVSGSSVASAATMGTVVIPEMRKYKYDFSLATGTLAAGGTLGILIPPSVTMIVYGMLTSQSIGKLFLAGFIPGVLQALMFIGVIGIICWRNPLLGPAGPRIAFIDKLKSLKNAWIVALLFILVIGGIYVGWFSPSEGAGIGAMGAFLFALARKRLTWKKINDALMSTVVNSAMIFFVLAGAMILGYFLAATRVPAELSAAIGGLQVSRYLIWIFVVIFYVFLGCLMDSLAMVLLTVPVIYPVMCGPGGLGFDPIWFGIMLVILVEIGLITPPVGMNVFIIKGLAPDVPTYTIFKGILPFLYVDIVQIALLTVIPGIILWLPSILK